MEEVKDDSVETELENVSIDSTSSGEVAITQNNQNSDTKLEPIVVPRQITGSDLQEAVTQRDLKCKTFNFKPAKAKREVKNPLRSRKYFTQVSFLSEKSEPLIYKQEVDSSSSAKWIEAMKEEMQSLKENETWTLVKPPKNRKIVPGKWVFKIKRNEHGAVEKYKARFVAKGSLK